MKIETRAERWELRSPFRITGHTFTAVDILVVTLSDGRYEGRGEAAGVYYLNTTPASMAAQIETVREQIEAGIDCEALRTLMPAAGARNAAGGT